MNSGSHSLTLGRLYAWEKKLYEEVKVNHLIFSMFSFMQWDLVCLSGQTKWKFNIKIDTSSSHMIKHFLPHWNPVTYHKN